MDRVTQKGLEPEEGGPQKGVGLVSGGVVTGHETYCRYYCQPGLSISLHSLCKNINELFYNLTLLRQFINESVCILSIYHLFGGFCFQGAQRQTRYSTAPIPSTLTSGISHPIFIGKVSPYKSL